MVSFKDVLCIYFEGAKEVLRFKGKEKLRPLQVPEKIGQVHSITNSGVLMISGHQGFAVYGEDFRCLCVTPMDCKINPEVLFTTRLDGEEQLKFVFDNMKSKKILKITHIEPRNFKLPEALSEGKIQRLVVSQSGNFVFAASSHTASVYKLSEE